MIQARVLFDGIQQVLDWTFSFSAHGITPSVCQIRIAPQFGWPAEIGTLTITDSNGTILNFEGCAVDRATVQRDGSGMIVAVDIIDRRWLWRFGEISGRYNVRNPDGTVDQDTAQTPQQLMTLLFQAMNENGDVSQLPNNTYPEVDWTSANPAQEAQSLAESLGCRIVLGLSGSVSVQVLGDGEAFPELPNLQQTRSFGIDPPNRPDSVKLVGGTTRFQSIFRLEAIGQEPDTVSNGLKTATGEIVPIAQLSYTPSSANGWGDLFPNSADSYGNVKSTTSATDRECQQKARQWVYRKYRILCTAESSSANQFQIQGTTVQVTDLWQLLPAEAGLIETYLQDGIETPLPPKLEGVWYDESLDAANNAQIRAFPENVSFSFDAQRGIVTLDKPLVKYDPATGKTSAPDLYLTVAHVVKDPDLLQPVRESFEVDLPGDEVGSGPQIERRDDVRRTLIGKYSNDGTSWTPGGTTDNYSQIQQEANYYLENILQTFETRETETAEFAGIILIEPDGAMQQITWVGGDGGGKTTISRNMEHDHKVPSYAERTAIVKNKKLLKQAAQITAGANARYTIDARIAYNR